MSGGIEQAIGVLGLAEWVRTGGMLGALGLAVKLYLDNRKLKLAEEQSDRDGYGDLIKLLREEVNGISVRHADCQHKLEAMQREIDGLRTELRARDAAIVRQIGGEAGASATRDAADKMIRRIDATD